MKHLASRQTTRRSHPARRYGAAFGALALLVSLCSAAAPAYAECSGPNLTVARANAVDYVCQVRCAASGGTARLLITRDRDGHDATPCMDLCDA